MIPVNDNHDVEDPDGGSHWALLVGEKTDQGLVFQYLDSLYSESTKFVARRVSQVISDILGVKIRRSDAVKCEKQNNSNDCGVFVLAFAEEVVNAIEAHRPPVFRCHPDLFRSRVLEEIDQLR